MKITCRVTFLYKVLSTKNSFLELKLTVDIVQHFLSVLLNNFSRLLEPLGCVSHEFSPMLTVATTYSTLLFISMWWNPQTLESFSITLNSLYGFGGWKIRFFSGKRLRHQGNKTSLFLWSYSTYTKKEEKWKQALHGGGGGGEHEIQSRYK